MERRRMQWAGCECGMYGKKSLGLGGEISRERPLGRLRYRWEGNIKMVLKNQGGGGGGMK